MKLRRVVVSGRNPAESSSIAIFSDSLLGVRRSIGGMCRVGRHIFAIPSFLGVLSKCQTRAIQEPVARKENIAFVCVIHRRKVGSRELLDDGGDSGLIDSREESTNDIRERCVELFCSLVGADFQTCVCPCHCLVPIVPRKNIIDVIFAALDKDRITVG